MDTRQSAGHARAPIEIKSDDGGANPTREAVREVMSAFEQFKSANDERLKQLETKGAADPLTINKVEAIEQKLAGYESLNQQLTQAEAKAKAAVDGMDELKTQLEAIELKLGRPRAPGQAAERKSRVNDWGRAVIGSYTLGVPNLNEGQRKALADVEAEYKSLGISNDNTGGYLAPPEFVTEIIKGVTEQSPIRALARLRTTGASEIRLPKRTGQFAARRTGDQEKREETDGLRYGMHTISAPEMYAIVDISNQNLEDSAFDLEAEIKLEAEEQFAVREGAEFVTGEGQEECQGILSAAAGVGSTASGHATLITADGILKLKHAIKTAYARNGTFVLNRTTLGSVRTLKDGEGRYVWMPGIAQGRPNTIDGDPYVEVPDMPNEAAGAKPVAYGDFQRAYTLVDRIAMQLLRDPYSQADNGLIRFRFRRRVGGRVVLAEAIRTLTCQA